MARGGPGARQLVALLEIRPPRRDARQHVSTGLDFVPQGSTRTALILTPILPALLIVAVTYWVYQACDEYIRSRILKCIAITAVIVAFCTSSYFVLELFGFPRLSMLWINLLGWSIFNLQMLYVILRSR
jgi:hypothetical protein